MKKMKYLFLPVLMSFVQFMTFGQEMTTFLSGEKSSYEGTSYRIVDEMKLKPGFRVRANQEGEFKARFVNENDQTYIRSGTFEAWLIGKGYDLSGYDNYVKTLNIVRLTELDWINDAIGISYFDGIEDFVSLERLYYNDGACREIDVSNNLRLKRLYLSFNLLTSLDVSKNTMLERLEVRGNNLTQLDISNNVNLQRLSAQDTEGITPLSCIQVNSDQLNDIDENPLNFRANSDVIFSTDCNYFRLADEDQNQESDLSISTPGFSVFPNPAKQKFTISNDQEGQSKLEIYDMTGSLLRQPETLDKGEHRVSTEGLHNGVVILRIINNDTVRESKLLIQR